MGCLTHVLSNDGAGTAGVDGTTRKALKEEGVKLQFVRDFKRN